MSYEENLKKAKAAGYDTAICVACANFSSPTTPGCKKCIAETPAFTKAVNEFLMLAPKGREH